MPLDTLFYIAGILTWHCSEFDVWRNWMLISTSAVFFEGLGIRLITYASLVWQYNLELQIMQDQ